MNFTPAPERSRTFGTCTATGPAATWMRTTKPSVSAALAPGADAAGAPAGCPQPCQAEIADHMALSTDGNLLAVSAVIPAAGSGGGASASSAVFTYARTGTTWAPQAALNAEGTFIASLALSGDGSTLAVGAPNDDHAVDGGGRQQRLGSGDNGQRKCRDQQLRIGQAG